MPTPPETCASLDAVRQEIDRIDRQLIHLIAERSHYVDAAARFKRDEQQVADPGRYLNMMIARRQWAAHLGIDPSIVDEIFQRLVSYFTRRETARFRELNARSSSPDDAAEVPQD